MGYSVGMWTKGYAPEALTEIADLWNRNARARHAFHPWTGELLAKQLVEKGKPYGTLLEARLNNLLAGFAHVAVVEEDGYPHAGAVEALLVDAGCRKMGMGTALLSGALSVLRTTKPRPMFVDALGAWPFGYGFNVLADGSERSGVFTDDTDTYKLFRRAGFEPVRKSFVMRADVAGPAAKPRPLPKNCGFFICRRTDRTWLDRVFRGRELWDHDLVRTDGRLLSRAIFGLMEGESRRENTALFSVFGVNTPIDARGKGYAGVNLSHMMDHLAGLGGKQVELHVYADNEPALRLYRSLGFQQVGETMMMHLRNL